MARECAVQSFEKAAKALNEDWGADLDGKQLQRWGRALGQELLDIREGELEGLAKGQLPKGPVNDPELLVVGGDGGRVQSREKDPETGSRWREDKVLTVTSYQIGDGKKRKPRPLVTTLLATMGDAKAFGRLARLEAERRGVRQARRVLVMGDGASWIDTIHQEHFGRHERIVDYYHAAEHLYEVAKAAVPEDMQKQKKLAENLKSLLWKGKVASVIMALEELAKRAGELHESDGPEHPRRVLWQNLGYFTRHQKHMNYAAYRKRGWPIGSGTVESGVKQFNKRVKGTEQFWHNSGVEPILALRGLWLSQDDRWNKHWRQTQSSSQTAA